MGIYDFNAAVKPISLRDLNAQYLQDQKSRQEVQSGNIQLQEQQQQLADRKAMTTAMHEWDGKNMEDLPGLMLKHGASANAVMSTKQGVIAQQKAFSDKTKIDLENDKVKHDYLAQQIDNVLTLPPEQQAQALEAAKADAVQRGYMSPQDAQALHYQTPDQLKLVQKGLLGYSNAVDMAAKKAATNAAGFKDAGGVMYDLRGEQIKPAEGQQTVPADAVTAGAMGVSPGTALPLATAKTAKEYAEAGQKVVSANGRMILVDAAGNKIKDMGAATPMVLNQINQGSLGSAPKIPDGVTGSKVLLYLPTGLGASVQLVGDGKKDYASEVARMNPAAKENFDAALHAYNPNFDQRDFGAGKTAMNAAAKGEVPTRIGDQKVAFNTAIQHADLLQQAADALKNGDQQTLNSLKNRFGNEFGEAGPVTAQAIANAYSREVTKMLSGGHLTDSEIGTTGKTLDPNSQSPAQLKSVIGAYRALSKSKLDQLNKQESDALNRNKGGGSAAVEPSATGPNGHKIVFRNGAWVDAQTGEAVK